MLHEFWLTCLLCFILIETRTTTFEVPSETVQTIEQTELTGMEPVEVIEPVYATEGDVSDVPEPEVVEFQITAPMLVDEPKPETRETTTIEIPAKEEPVEVAFTRPKLTRQMSEKTIEIVSKGIEYMYEMITKAIEEERELTVTEKELIRQIEISQLEMYIKKTKTVITQKKFEVRKQQLIIEQQKPLETVEFTIVPEAEMPAETAPETTVVTTQEVTLEGDVKRTVTTKKTSTMTVQTKVVETETPAEEYVVVEDVGFFPVQTDEEATESTAERPSILRVASFTSSEEGYFTPEEDKPDEIVTTVEESLAVEQVTDQFTTETKTVVTKTMQTEEQVCLMKEESIGEVRKEPSPEAPAVEDVKPEKITETKTVEVKKTMQTEEQVILMKEESIGEVQKEPSPEAPAVEEIKPEETQQVEQTTRQELAVAPTEQQGTYLFRSHPPQHSELSKRIKWIDVSLDMIRVKYTEGRRGNTDFMFLYIKAWTWIFG